MRWQKPNELRRWMAEDQIVLRKWRRAVFTFYGVVIGLLIFATASTMRHNQRVEPDSVTALRGQKPSQLTNAVLPVMHRSH
jgi:hypothetical protein